MLVGSFLLLPALLGPLGFHPLCPRLFPFAGGVDHAMISSRVRCLLVVVASIAFIPFQVR